MKPHLVFRAKQLVKLCDAAQGFHGCRECWAAMRTLAYLPKHELVGGVAAQEIIEELQAVLHDNPAI